MQSGSKKWEDERNGSLSYKAATYSTVLRQRSRSRLSHKQEMERPYNEGKQHQPQSSRTCYVHNKVLQNKGSASINNNNIILRRRHKYLLQRRRWHFRETKPQHDSDGRLQCSHREKNKQTNFFSLLLMCFVIDLHSVVELHTLAK